MGNILKYFLVLGICCKSFNAQLSTYSNPVLDEAIDSAVVFRQGGNFFLVYADNVAKELRILKSPFLTDFRNAEKSVVYRLPYGYTEFYPSSFLEYQNDLYLYFHMKNQTVPYRMFAIKALDSKDPLGMWSAPSRILDHISNSTSAHGTAVRIYGQLYFVWVTPSETNSNWSLNIAKMKNPTEVLEPVVQLREQIEEFELSLEGPSFLYSIGKVYMVFTSYTSNATTGSYLSAMSIEVDSDPMNPSNWQTDPESIFHGNQEENVFHPRNSKFTKSSDGTETWMLYAASSQMSDVLSNFRLRIERIDWNKADGSPVFPEPKANGYQMQLPSGEPSKFVNHIGGEFLTYHPNAFRVGKYYYAGTVSTSRAQMLVLKSDKLYDFSEAEKSVVYTADAGFATYPGRIYEINGEFYQYFTLKSANQEWLNYVMKAENKSNLLDSWGTPIRILEGVQGYHSSILQLNNQNYFVFSNEIASRGNIYIAPMRSPTEIMEPVVQIKEPTQDWECYTQCFTEYPSFVYHNNVAFMVYAASFLTSPSASLSYMSIENGKDPLDVTNWYTAPWPVFTRNDAENVYATGRAWFTTSPDGLEDWMMYQGSASTSDIAGSRKIRVQKIDWDENTGHPIFPKARGYTYPLAIPSSYERFTIPSQQQ